MVIIACLLLHCAGAHIVCPYYKWQCFFMLAYSYFLLCSFFFSFLRDWRWESFRVTQITTMTFISWRTSSLMINTIFIPPCFCQGHMKSRIASVRFFHRASQVKTIERIRIFSFHSWHDLVGHLTSVFKPLKYVYAYSPWIYMDNVICENFQFMCFIEKASEADFSCPKYF